MQDLPNNMDEDEKHKLAYVMLHSDKKLLDKIHKLASKNHVNRKYEYRPYVSDEDVKSGRLKCKTVFVLEAKKTGKSYLDRAGKINY